MPRAAPITMKMGTEPWRGLLPELGFAFFIKIFYFSL